MDVITPVVEYALALIWPEGRAFPPLCEMFRVAAVEIAEQRRQRMPLAVAGKDVGAEIGAAAR